ncbi:MAG TPA: hypothetical protein VF402_07580 [Asticcacaulis sp.]
MHPHSQPAQIIPFPARRAQRPARAQNADLNWRVSIDGEFSEDDLPPELFDADEDREALALYAHIADQWADQRNDG